MPGRNQHLAGRSAGRSKARSGSRGGYGTSGQGRSALAEPGPLAGRRLRSSAFPEPAVLLPWPLHFGALLKSVHETVEGRVREFHLQLLRETENSKGPIVVSWAGGHFPTKPAQGLKRACVLLPLELDQDQIQQLRLGVAANVHSTRP